MTNTKLTDEQVIKTDGLGRVQTPAARREKLLDEFEGSGLSGAKFALLTGIKYSTFATWALRRRRQRGVTASAKVPVKSVDQVQWLEAVVAQAHGSKDPTPLVLHLPGGARLELVEVNQVAEKGSVLIIGYFWSDFLREYSS